MTEERGNAVLLHARNTYVLRFTSIVGPHVLAFFDHMYSNVRKSDKPLRTFQAHLLQVPEWNASVIKHHTDLLSLKSDCLDEIIAALFVSQVKVLTSIRLSAQKKSVSLKIPSNEDFMHRYFIEVAQQFYYNPFIFKNRDARKKQQVLVSSVDEAVNLLLPHRKILRACLGDFVNDDRSFDTFEGGDRHDDERENDGDRRSDDHRSDDVGALEEQQDAGGYNARQEYALPTDEYKAPPLPEPQPMNPADVKVVTTPDAHVETITDAPFNKPAVAVEHPVYDDFFVNAPNLP